MNRKNSDHPITIYIKECSFKGGIGYSYTFLKNVALFKWMLGMPYFTFNKIEKKICSEAKQEILDYLEIAGRGRLRINKYHLLKEHVENTIVKQKGGISPIIIPKFDNLLRLNIQEGVYEDKQCYFLTTDSVNNAKAILLQYRFISYHRKLSAFSFDRSEKVLAKLIMNIKGKAYVILPSNVILQSLYVQSLFWNQSYKTGIFPPIEYLKHLKANNYSLNTIKNYYSCFHIYLYYCDLNKINYQKVKGEEINNYVVKIATYNKHSASTSHQMINAVMYYYKNILKYPEVDLVKTVQRPQKNNELPKVLNKKQVETIINNCENIKHKTISLLYAAGLRSAELINLKITDIDGERKLIYIYVGERAKRIVQLCYQISYLIY